MPILHHVYWLVAFIVVMTSACTPNIEKEELSVSDAISQQNLSTISARLITTPTRYSFNKNNYAVEWFGCLANPNWPSVLVINPDDMSFTEEQACSISFIQAFLNQKYNVIAVNRPGYGQTTPPEKDFSGPASRAAIKAAVWQAIQLNKGFRIPSGIWATGSATIAGCFWSKGQKGIDWIILGEGIYDLEQFAETTTNQTRKQELIAARQNFPSDQFQEERSIAWDTSELPPKIIIYHSKNSDLTPFKQAEAFRDALVTEEYQVRFVPVDIPGNALSANAHAAIISDIIENKLP